jgi:hypothetical protein
LLALLVTAFFVAGAVLQSLLAFDVLGAAPPDQEDFIDTIVAFFAWEQTRWPIDFAATSLFGLGFLALGGLGALLARLERTEEPRRVLTTAAFVGAAVIGAMAQLLWLGAKPVATSAQYCDCGLRAEEIMSRLMALNIVSSVTLWIVIGATVLLAVAAVLVAPIGRAAGMPVGWVWLTYALAVATLISDALGVLRAYPFDQLSLLLVAGVMIPLWALWLAIRADSLVPAGATPVIADEGIT